ncbi:molybdenum ABC transporter ATP-binding protein [Maritalea sp.]|uniref:molybdenum ABC transporter ATP-binding protein n=1 Tax=Maritalea sp. TaxID=2003361 RepID=UPI003EF0CC5B
MLEVDVQGIRGNPNAQYRFTAKAGITAIVGPSGAGKTSLLRAIAGLDEVRGGQIKLTGEVLPPKPEKRQLGMVFQEPRLLPHLNILQNIDLERVGPKPAAEIADQLGIGQLLGRSPRHLSGGEKQRVMIARALFGAPKMMLFDEPLSAIDPHLKSELVDLIRTQFGQANIPVLYVTHQIEEAAQLAHSLIAIEEGHIVAQGPLAATMAKLDGPSFFENGITSILSGLVTGIDQRFGLATVSVGQQQVDLVQKSLKLGDKVQLRIWARDVLLAKDRLTGVSARNQLAGEILSIDKVDIAHSDVLVRVEGEMVRARIMNKTAAELDMAVGHKIFVVFKSVSIE